MEQLKVRKSVAQEFMRIWEQHKDRLEACDSYEEQMKAIEELHGEYFQRRYQVAESNPEVLRMIKAHSQNMLNVLANELGCENCAREYIRLNESFILLIIQAIEKEHWLRSADHIWGGTPVKKERKHARRVHRRTQVPRDL